MSKVYSIIANYADDAIRAIKNAGGKVTNMGDDIASAGLRTSKGEISVFKNSRHGMYGVTGEFNNGDSFVRMADAYNKKILQEYSCGAYKTKLPTDAPQADNIFKALLDKLLG